MAAMTHGHHPTSRGALALEIAVFLILAVGLKAALNLWTWRLSGPISLVVLLVIMSAYFWVRKERLSAIGLVSLATLRSRLWLAPQTLLAFVGVLATGVAVAFAGEASGIAFMQPDPTGAEARFGDLEGNTRLFLAWLAILWVAGPAEELVFRGYLVSRLSTLFGDGRGAAALSVAVSAMLFGLGHVYYLGLRGLVLTGAIGLTLAVLFLVYRRNVWPLMVAHAAVNSLVFTAQYANWDI